VILKLLSLLSIISTIIFASPLQDAIDQAKDGALIELKAGVYEGNLHISKSISIIGKEDGVIIKGDGKGTIITIESSFVTLKNLRITHSGERHDQLASAISIKNSKHCEISNIHIDDALFGIDLQGVSNSKIINNFITSKIAPIGLRGDGIRLWYSNDNIIEHNVLDHSRDMVVWYSNNNQINYNRATHCRYSLHFMHSGRNYVRNNHFEFNSVGIFLMYSIDTVVENNLIKSSLGATGMGIGLKDVSDIVILNNTIIYNAQGLYIDRSPFEPGSKNEIHNNKIFYNAEAIHFHSLSENNHLTGNDFKGNIEDVINDSLDVKTHKNLFTKNYYDSYEGFDRDNDNIGDTPHKEYQYADKLWLYNNNVKFFYGSPVISLLNFLAKLAPFSEPVFLFEDKQPVLSERG